MQPYKDTTVTENTFTRTFLESTDDIDLLWHRDRKTRIIKPTAGTNWHFQEDDKLPVLLSTTNTVMIEAGKWHRLIKGEGDLILEIKEL
jgi:hypothetical protein